MPEQALVKVKPEADSEIMAFHQDAVRLLEYATARVIATVEDLKPASDDLVIIRKVKKGMEDKRKEYLQPFQSHVKETNEAYKFLMEPIEQADKITVDKILAFDTEQKRIRQEQERINSLRMEAAQKEMKLNGEISESVNLVEVLPEAPKRVSTDMGSVRQRENWKCEVIDFALVPDQYKMINAGVVTPVVKASKGKITIPGIRIYLEKILASTPRNA